MRGKSSQCDHIRLLGQHLAMCRYEILPNSKNSKVESKLWQILVKDSKLCKPCGAKHITLQFLGSRLPIMLGEIRARPLMIYSS